MSELGPHSKCNVYGVHNLYSLTKGHVTDKTLGRVEHVFGFLKDKKNLDSFFSAKHDALRDDLCKKLQIVQEKDAI